MNPKFLSPPINELVIGVYFKEPILGFRAEHVGLFWSNLRTRYPQCSQQVPLGGLDIEGGGDVFPLPRFWFASENGDLLLQLQRNALLLNWRKREKAYPHYDAVKGEFNRVKAELDSFVRSTLAVELPSVAQCELAYINLFEDQEYFRDFADTKNVIPSFQPLSITGKAVKGFQLNYVYETAADIRVFVSIQSRLNPASNKEVLYLELKAASVLKEDSALGFDMWFDRAHEVIGEMFSDMTDRDIQLHHWKRLEG